MQPRSSLSRVLLTFAFGLLLSYPGALPAQEAPPAPELPIVQAGSIMSIESGAAPKKIELSYGESLTLQLNKPIQSVLGFNTSMLRVSALRPDMIRIDGRGPGQTTLSIRDEQDTLTDVAITVKKERPGKLRTVLDELYPDAKLQLYELNGSMLVRGTVPTRGALHEISAIARQFYPSVLTYVTVKEGVAPKAESAQIPKGMRVVSARVSDSVISPVKLSAGDHVGVIVAYTTTHRDGRTITHTNPLLADVEIFAISEKNVSLLVTPEEASYVSLAERKGTISLVPQTPQATAAKINKALVAELSRLDDKDADEPADGNREAELQSDLRALHADVKRLIELLEQRQSSTGGSEKPQAADDQAARGKHEYFAPPARIDGRDYRPDAADAEAPRTTFLGIVKLGGAGPFLPPAAQADHSRNFTDEPIPDDSLIVGGNNGLANVFVYLHKPPSPTDADGRERDEPVKLMSRKGRLLPRCSIVRVGQDVQLQNFDPALASFHTFPLRNPAVNMAIAPNNRSGGTFHYERPELVPIKIGDDVHPWKRAYHLVVDHPYAALTDQEGRFRIDGLPPGDYEFRLWHERAGYIDQSYRVRIDDERAVEAEITVDVGSLLAQQPRTAEPDSPRIAELNAVPASTKSPGSPPPAVAQLTQKRLLLYFYADWAEPSRSVRSLVKFFAELEGVRVLEIDVARSRSLATYFGITQLPTLMLIDNRKEIGRTVKWENRDDLRLFISAALQPTYDFIWNVVGLRLVPLQSEAGELAKHNGRYRGGMTISEVREDFPHPHGDGLRQGDVLVGLGLSEITNIGSVAKAIKYDHKTDESGKSWIRFYAVRDGVSLDGELRIIKTDQSDEHSTDGSAEDLSDTDDAEARTVLLFFNATWCGPCQEMVPVIREIAEEGIVPVRTVDVDKNRALTDKHSISSIPALVVLRDGQEVDRMVGAATVEAIRGFIQTREETAVSHFVGFKR